MVNYVRVYSGDDGQSHLEEFEPDFNPFVDTEGAHGEGTPMESATGITIRRNPPGYFLDFHCAPRRQYSITIAGEKAEGDPAEALSHYQALAEGSGAILPPEEGLLGVARCQEAMGRTEEALETYRRLLTEFPESEYAGEAREKVSELS